MSNSTLTLILAVIIGVYEIQCIKNYGIYPIPYFAISFVGLSLLISTIESIK